MFPLNTDVGNKTDALMPILNTIKHNYLYTRASKYTFAAGETNAVIEAEINCQINLRQLIGPTLLPRYLVQILSN